MKIHNCQFITAIVLATAALTAPLQTAFANSHTWAGLGITGNWSLPANWAANNPPAAGEAAPVILIFPSGASRLTNTNNVAGLVVDGLSITGNNYVLHGSGSGTNLTFHDNGLNSIFVNGAGNTLAGTLNLTLSGAVQFNVSGGLAIASKLLGSGSLTKNLPGTLTLNGAVANAFTGGATVNDGALNLASGFPFFSGWIGEDAVPGPLTIGNGTGGWSPSVVLLQSDQIADAATVTLASNGNFLLNNHNDSIGALNLTGGYVQTGTGTLTLGGNVNVNTNPNPSGIYGILSLGGATRTISTAGTLYIGAGIVDGVASAGLIKTGAGLLELGGSNSFSGTTVATGGRLVLDLDSPVGAGSQGTFITNAVLQLLGATVTGHPLTLAGSSSIVFTFSNSWNGAVTLATGVPVAGTAAVDSVNFNGVISGTGPLQLNGAGTVKFSGAGDNTYSGNTALNFGTLLLQKPAGTRAVPGNLIIGRDADVPKSAEVRLGADHQIINGFVGSVTVKNSGYLNLNNHNQTVPQLLLSDSAQVDSGINGMLTLGGDLAFSKVNGGHSDVYGRLSLGGADRVFALEYSGWILFMHASINDGGAPAGFRLNGGGTLFMLHSNSFSGPLIIDNSVFIADDNFAFGATNGGTFLTNDAVIDLEGISVAGEPLSIASTGFFGYDFSGLVCTQTNSWSGPVQLVTGGFINSKDTNSVLNLSGPISGTGGLEVFGAGLVQLTGMAPNTFTGTLDASVKLLELNKTNALAVYGPLQIQSGGTVRHRGNHQILDTSPVSVESGGLFDLNGFAEVIADLNGDGQVNLGAGVLTVGGASPSATFNGVISGAGGELDKVGPNTLVLSGDNTYTSGTLVKGGKLIVNGSQPSSDVYVYSGATIGGYGTIGKIYGLGGTISPGNSPGILNSGSLVLNTNAAFFIELNGPDVGTGYDQLNVTGSVQFHGPVTLNVSKHFVGAVGNQYVILNINGGAILFERFAGLPEGATFTADGTQFSISYQGGTGNDVVLTQLSLTTPPQISSIQKVANGSIQVLGQGLPGYAYTAQANDDLNTTNWITLGIIITDQNTGDFAFYDLDAPNHSKRFYRLLAQ